MTWWSPRDDRSGAPRDTTWRSRIPPMAWTSSDMEGHDRASLWPSDRHLVGSPSPAVHLWRSRWRLLRTIWSVHLAMTSPPSDVDRVVLVSAKIRRSRRVHVAKGKPWDHFTYSGISARVIISDRVDSSPRDLGRSSRIRRSSSCHASCKTKIVWEHSPTRKKLRGKTRLNSGAVIDISQF